MTKIFTNQAKWYSFKMVCLLPRRVTFLLVVLPILHGTASSVSVGQSEAESGNGKFPVSKECGGVLEGNYGEIRYKYGDQFDPYEGCVWTISVGHRNRIKINILKTFSADSNCDYLQIGYFNQSAYDQSELFEWIRLPMTSPQTLEVSGPVAFVQFVSDHSQQGLGFSITFEAGVTEHKSAYNYHNHFVTGERGIFKYPVRTTNYGKNERTTIVVKSWTLASQLYIQHVDIEESGECLVDSVNFYQFNYTMDPFSTGWKKIERFCGAYRGYASMMSFSTQAHRLDPIIVTFKSDHSTEGKGFELFWVSPYKNNPKN